MAGFGNVEFARGALARELNAANITSAAAMIPKDKIRIQVCIIVLPGRVYRFTRLAGSTAIFLVGCRPMDLRFSAILYFGKGAALLASTPLEWDAPGEVTPHLIL